MSSISLRSRYQEQSPRKQSFSLLTQKQDSLIRRNYSSSNGFRPCPPRCYRNPQNELNNAEILPSIFAGSRMRKSLISSSTFESDRNTRFKLITLQDKLNQIRQDVYFTRKQTQGMQMSLQQCRQVSNNLLNRDIVSIKQTLKNDLLSLQSIVKNIKQEERQKTEALKDDCNKLWYKNQAIKNRVFDLRIKIDDLEIRMGYQN